VVGKFIKHVVPSVIRPLRVLWNEVIGFVFLVLAAGGLVYTWKEVQQPESPVTVAVPVVWTLVMGYFAVTSFMRARRISRS
jgi:hypothetical protein